VGEVTLFSQPEIAQSGKTIFIPDAFIKMKLFNFKIKKTKVFLTIAL